VRSQLIQQPCTLTVIRTIRRQQQHAWVLLPHPSRSSSSSGRSYPAVHYIRSC
jgi:hypothetical protein